MLGSHAGDYVLDPFGGSGTTGFAASQLSRKSVLIELNPDYVEKSVNRFKNIQPELHATP
jgi:DNA modification methylase